jgi:hypothetical protein
MHDVTGWVWNSMVVGPLLSKSSSLAGAAAEAIEPAYVPTADTPQCFVGYICPTSSRLKRVIEAVWG